MPNVELHGYEPEAAATVKAMVRMAVTTSPNADEIVTTVYPTEVEDLKGNKTPFLRVISSLRELPDLLERLRPLNEDMEILMLGQWIPKQRAPIDEQIGELFDMDAWQFFSEERFLANGVPHTHVARAVNGTREACKRDYSATYMTFSEVPERPIRTVREFLTRYEHLGHLERIPNFGSKSREAVKTVLRRAGILPANWS